MNPETDPSDTEPREPYPQAISLEILDIFRSVRFQRIFVDWTGSVTAALFLSQLVFWTPKTQNKYGWIHKTITRVYDETGLTRYEQASARRCLLETGMIQEKLHGIPARMYFRLGIGFFERLLRLQTSQLVGYKPANSLAGNQPSNAHRVQHKLHFNEAPRVPRRSPPRKSGSYSLGIETKDDKHQPYSEDAAYLANKFYEYLVERNLHLARSDLPRGNSPPSKKKRAATFNKWTRFAEELLEQMEGDVKRIRRTMGWYFENYRSPGVGAHHSLNTWCENFHKIEKAMHWKDRSDPSGPQVQSRSVEQETVHGLPTEEEM